MKPEEPCERAADDDPRSAASKAYATADRVYQKLTRPDRPLLPEKDKKPWLAALLSLVVVGAGQLYNRQLAKAVLLFGLFFVAGGVVLLAYVILNHFYQIGERLPELATAFQLIWGSLWLFAVVDAYRTAQALRAGRLVVRYGFLRQGLYAAASFLPFAGALIPKETVAPEEANRSVGAALKEVAKERVVAWLVLSVLRVACLVVGVILLLVGLIAGNSLWITAGALAVAAGIILFLV